uniref:Eukaryotic translation initiation factor 4 gamma 3 n=1 Tax=Ascaris suum TaxID=6253 RepID=F1KRP4_ASCSU
MSSSNPRGKQRKNGAMQDYNGQHLMGAQVGGVVPPSQPPQLIPNGNAGQQQPTGLGFVIPTVDTAHSNHMPQAAYRSAPRNLPNPSMQFAPGEVHVERPQQGTPQITTIHPTRYAQQPQAQQPFPPTSQMATFTSAPPMYNPPNVYNANVYSTPSAYSTFQPQAAYYQPAAVTPQMFTSFYQMQAPEFLQQRVGVAYPQTAMLVPVQTQPPVHQKEKKILRIVDPDTKEVTNEKEISASMCAPLDEHMSGDSQGGRRSAALEASRENVPHPSNASQKFSLQVAQSVLADSAIPSSSSAPAPSQVRVPTPTPVAPREVSPVPHSAPSAASTSTPPPAAHVEEMPAEVPPESTVIEEKPPEVAEEAKEQKIEEALVEKDEKDKPKNIDKSESEQAPEQVGISPQPSESAAVQDVALTSEPEEPKVVPEVEEPPSTAGRPVEVVPEEAEKEEKAAEEDGEPEGVKFERKRKELEKRQQELLQDPANVDINAMVYGRSYLVFMREVVKELKKDSCPVEESELKSLGIDIASAPAVSTLDRQQRRLDGLGSASRAFAPGWMPDNKNPLKPKAYHGRLSDRGHSQRTDRDRKRGPISRPSIDRPAREPVKLHRSENAWKHEPSSNLDKNQQLYKDIRGLLNKITPSTFDALCADFLSFKVYQNKEQMSEVISIIFDKAVEEPKFCPLYSDLCKKQVVEESQESGKSEFRSGILTRCQQTFETKRQEEINKKRAEAEAETDERRQKELKLEVMEMEAKERRRMFGNIGFIGQLFRHELIVPRILNWCIIHLLKNHSEAELQGGSDEESIECAVRMLETVGKIADRQGLSTSRQDSQGAQSEFNLSVFFTHLSEIAPKVSNRVRFLILNLIELKNNNWNPRKSADSGPKTIEEVHSEARKEEIQNKLQREQYEKKRGPYEGRPSLDRRSQRPTIIGRQSQDGRYGRGGDSSRDQKARAAGAASMVASTASRKNQSLNSMDQPQSLGARRPQFSSGSAGGGQQTERNAAARSMIGVRGAGRGSLASRDNSQPSSREPSESRRQSSNDERVAALAAASAMTHSSSSGGLKRSGYASAAGGGGGSSSALSSTGADDKSTGSDHGDHEHDRDDDAARAAKEKQAFSMLVGDLNDYFADNVDVEQVYTCVMEVCETTAVRVVFRLIMQVGIEKVSGAVTNPHRRYVGQVICRCLQADQIKQDALHGIADFCTYVVENELWEDNMRVWEAVAEIISWSIMCDTQHFEGARPSIGDFREAFTNANADTRKADALLFYVLRRLVEIEYEREKRISSMGMAFDEIKDLRTDALIVALKGCHLTSGENLYELLN